MEVPGNVMLDAWMKASRDEKKQDIKDRLAAAGFPRRQSRTFQQKMTT